MLTHAIGDLQSFDVLIAAHIVFCKVLLQLVVVVVVVVVVVAYSAFTRILMILPLLFLQIKH